MDINRIRSERISRCAKGIVIDKFFPDHISDEYANDENLSARAQDIHAGALCLYAVTLLTKVYEQDFADFKAESSERHKSLVELIKASPRYSQRSDDEIENIAQEMINKDIRNSFAHGNFEISYDIYSKKLYFVLKPQRRDFVTDIPIVISKGALFKANRKHVVEQRAPHETLTKTQIEQSILRDFGKTFKSFILPVQMLKLAEYYLEKPEKYAKPLVLSQKEYAFIQYLLSIAKITYEQDDYYNIFGKDSTIFEKMAIVRNAVAHDTFDFEDNISGVNHADRQRSFNESLQKSAGLLAVANAQKDLMIRQINNGNYSHDAIQSLAAVLDECFDFVFSNRGLDDNVGEDNYSI